MRKADLLALVTAVLATLTTWGKWPLIAISAIIAFLALILRARGFQLASSVLLLALSPLPPYPICLICSLLSIPILDVALRQENKYPWWAYTSAFALTAISALAFNACQVAYTLMAPLTYIIFMTAYSAARLGLTRLRLMPDRDLTVVAGSPLTYKLKLTTHPPVKCIVTFKAPRNVKVRPVRAFLNESLVLRCKARFELGGVKKPKLRLVLSDVRGLVRLVRTLEHPPIAVIPRAKKAIEHARKALQSPGGFEEVSHIREWTPGDLPKFIHWKKSVGRKRLLVKVFIEEAPHADLLVFSYASNATKADMLCEVMVYTALNAVMRFGIVSLELVDRYGNCTVMEVTRNNFMHVIQEAMSKVQVLGIKRVLTDPMHQGIHVQAHAFKRRFVDELLRDKGNIVVIGDCLFLNRLKDAFSSHNAILICV